MQSIFTVILTIVAVPGGYAQWICIRLLWLVVLNIYTCRCGALICMAAELQMGVPYSDLTTNIEM